MLTHLRQHRTRQFFRLSAGLFIGKHMTGNLADPLTRMFAGVMLRERRTREFLFYRGHIRAFQYDSGEMRDMVRGGFIVSGQLELP